MLQVLVKWKVLPDVDGEVEHLLQDPTSGRENG